MVTNEQRTTNNRVNLEQVRSWTVNRADFCNFWCGVTNLRGGRGGQAGWPKWPSFAKNGFLWLPLCQTAFGGWWLPFKERKRKNHRPRVVSWTTCACASHTVQCARCTGHWARSNVLCAHCASVSNVKVFSRTMTWVVSNVGIWSFNGTILLSIASERDCYSSQLSHKATCPKQDWGWL